MHTSTPTLSASTSTVLPFSDRRGHAISTPAAPYSEPASAIDEDEWAAFEADIAATTTEITSEAANALSVAVSATTIPSTAVISAAPTGPSTTTHTDEELTPTGYTESEAQLDRQDAENKLVEEFEAMEGLEGRVRRLKEKREELRVKAAGSAGARMDFTAADEEEGPGGADEEEGPGRTDEEEEEEEEEEDDDDDEEDDWIHYAR